MIFNKFETKCVGIAIDEWPHLMIGIFKIEDDTWGMLSPIPADNPLSKSWQGVDSELYVRLKDVKLIKLITYDENKEANKNRDLFGPSSAHKDPSKTVVG
jgi:hypothetical protein